MIIYLIRHGQDEDNAAGVYNGRRNNGLTKHGFWQVEQTAQSLKDCGIGQIYHSPLFRAQTTARIIADVLEVPMEVIPDLIERDFGIMTGVAKTEVLNFTQQVITVEGISYFVEAQGAESMNQLMLRAENVYQEVKLKHSQDTVALVGHEYILKCIQAVHNGGGWQEALNYPFIENAQALRLED